MKLRLARYLLALAGLNALSVPVLVSVGIWTGDDRWAQTGFVNVFAAFLLALIGMGLKGVDSDAG